MGYQPGQTVKGYVLGEDRRWYPAGVPDAVAVPNGYGDRYRRRWPITALIVGVLNAISSTLQEWSAHTNASWGGLVLYFVLAIVGGGLVLGSIVNLIVALPGSQGPPPRRAAGVAAPGRDEEPRVT